MTRNSGYKRIAKTENTKKMYIFHKFRNSPRINRIIIEKLTKRIGIQTKYI